jgi:nitroreductase
VAVLSSERGGAIFKERRCCRMNAVKSTQYARAFDIIKQRRSIGQFTREQPTQAQIERLLDAATYAPNHHVAEPWHFFVLTGMAREDLGEIMAASLRARLDEQDSEAVQLRLWKERQKPLRAPVIITVATKEEPRKNESMIEDIEATAAAVQNMLLAAEEMGLGTIWRTGDAAYDPLVKRWFGLTSADHIVAFVYVGFPACTRQMRVPTPFSAKTTWLS